MKVERIVFLGTFGPPSLTLARRCHAMGISMFLLTPGTAGSTSRAPSPPFAGAAILDEKKMGTPQGIEQILHYVRQAGAQALATLAEFHSLWLARNSTSFTGFCKLLLPPVDCLEVLASKARQIELARAAGFTVLPTYLILTKADASEIKPDAYPLCLRPASPDSVKPPFKVRLARSSDELLQRLEHLTIERDGLLAQPFRVLPNMVIHGASREGGELLHAAAFLADRKFEGLALRIRPMAISPDLVDSIRRFSRMANLSGPYHFDFLHSERTGESYYLEVNARFGGTTDKVLWLGVDEAADAFEAYGLQPPRRPRRLRIARRAIANKRATLKHLLTMLRRGPEPWDYPQESRIRAVLHSASDLLLARDSIFDRRDLRGTLAFHLQGRG